MEWILYQIGGAQPNKYRFIVTPGFQDEAVERLLQQGEFIDSTTTLLGELGGDVMVLQADADALPDLLVIAQRTAEHFEYTDAPLGIDARAAVSKALKKEQS